MRFFPALLLLACADGRAAPAPASQAPPGFWDTWGDGRAELAGYALTIPRYGELRTGEAVVVTVSETFTLGTRVKSDGGHDDEVPVLKQNTVLDFQTGVYDYNAMTSTWLRLDGGDPRGAPTKVTFSMQEWCGSVLDELVARGGGYDHELRSYFDGESVVGGRLDRPAGALSEDALPMVIRGLTGPPPQGEVRLLPRLVDARLHHQPLAWVPARLAPGPARTLDTPAGPRQVVPWTLAVPGRGARTWYVETEEPHVIAGWDGEDGESARLTGVTRAPYWQQHGEADEGRRADLGLPPRPRP